MNLTQITPMILTHNEDPNLRDTLERLQWAQQILIVDSFSDDQTLTIASEFSNVCVAQRKFVGFAEQCNVGLSLVSTPWVLSLDADYKCSPSLMSELEQLDGTKAGYEARFQYGVYGRPLRSSLYPNRTVLYRLEKARYERDGHAHRVRIDGEIGQLENPILHDDWKPLSTWLESQIRYANHEADKLLRGEDLSWKDRIRSKILFAAPLTLVYCLFVKRLLLDGWRGAFYSLQRTVAEMVLSLVLIDRRLRSSR